MTKAHFSWTWQCTTLNRGDELTNLLLLCIQPHRLSVPDFRTSGGRNFGRNRAVFGVLSMYHETKIPKPGVCEPLLVLSGSFRLLQKTLSKMSPITTTL
jgi:hypothetical protein